MASFNIPPYLRKQMEEKDQEKKQNKEENQSIKKQCPIENGGTTEKYSWTQTVSELTVHVPVPKGTRARMLNINITPTHLKVEFKGKTILEGNFQYRVKAEESSWTLDEHKKIIIELEKVKTLQWWSCVLEGDPEIDLDKLGTQAIPFNELNASDLDRVHNLLAEKKKQQKQQE